MSSWAIEQLHSDPVAARQPNETCMKSLWQGKTLLAADVPRNRDASPESSGCLWFEADNPRDLGYRMAFVGRNPEFRAAMGAAGRCLSMKRATHLLLARDTTKLTASPPAAKIQRHWL